MVTGATEERALEVRRCCCAEIFILHVSYCGLLQAAACCENQTIFCGLWISGGLVEIIYSQVHVENGFYVGVCVRWACVWTRARTDGQI